tara:strand:+ start:2888 stop:3217 length:330 start_codon:yes stop_codon:yes gene_type:complete
MEIINSKRHKDFIQDLRDILNQTQMISYETKNKEISNKLSEIVIPYFIEVISYVEVNDLKNINLNFSLSKCVHQIIDLADSNKNLMMLSSKYKVIREEISNLIYIDDEK